MSKTFSIAQILCMCLFLLLLAACSTSRYSMEHDIGPTGSFDASQLPDAVPKWEPLSRGGNKSPYNVRGKSYHIVKTAKDFKQEGVASWYGLKFHGELTSNGEIYNMYEMSAAHKTLPLPSYVRVRNLDNQRSVVVRVNDRGPFHNGRVIDLSYAAATKLGYANNGTANVMLESIVVDQPQEFGASSSANEPVINDRLGQFVQIAAYSNLQSAKATKSKLESKLGKKLVDKNMLFVAPSPERSPPIYRVRMGPVYDSEEADNLLAMIKNSGIGQPMLITRAISAKGR